MVSIQKSHLRAISKAGLERFPFYCRRHTFGTRCAESGMDRHTLAKLTSHSSPRITAKYYIHVTEDYLSGKRIKIVRDQESPKGAGAEMSELRQWF